MEYDENQEKVTPDPRKSEQRSQEIEEMSDTAEPVKNILAFLGLVPPLSVSAEKSQEEILQELESPERERRVAAVRAMEEEEEPLAMLQLALRHRDEAVRATAIRVAGSFKAKVQIDLLLEGLRDPAWYVRASAAHELGSQIERAPIVPLIEALNDEDESVRAEAVWALGMLKEHAPEIVMDALHDRSRLVREAAEQVVKQHIEQSRGSIESKESEVLKELVMSEEERKEPSQSESYLSFGEELILPGELSRKRLPDTGPLTRYKSQIEEKRRERRSNQEQIRENWAGEEKYERIPGSMPARGADKSRRRDKDRVKNNLSRVLIYGAVAMLLLGFGLVGGYNLRLHSQSTLVANQGSPTCVFHLGKSSQAMAWSTEKKPSVNRLFAVAGSKGKVDVYNADSCRPVTEYQLGSDSSILALRWIKDGLRIAIVKSDGSIQVVQENNYAQSEVLLMTGAIAGAGSGNLVVSLSEDGQQLAISGGDNTAQLWNIQEKAFTAYRSPYGQITALSWSPDNTEIAAAAFDSKSVNGANVEIWEIKDRRATFQPIPVSAKVEVLAWSENGKSLLLYDQSNLVSKWNRQFSGFTPLNTDYVNLPQPISYRLALAWAPDNKRFVMSTAKDIQIYSADTAQLLGAMPNEFANIIQLSWSGDGKHIAAASSDGTVEIWEVAG